jgi:hypothetical protein
MGELRAAIIAAVEAEPPITVRGVYYRCVSVGAIPKTEAAYTTVQQQLVMLRRNAMVKYADITDGTRWVVAPVTYDSVEDALTQTARTYRRALWVDSQYRPMLFIEKDAISGVVAPVTNEWDIPRGVLRGYSSETFAYSVGSGIDEEYVTLIAQLGDHDPSGVHAWNDFRRKVKSFAPRRAEIEFTRLAVTEKQISSLDLPTRPTKPSDTRSKNWSGGSVEVDAIPPTILRAIVSEWIDAFVDQNDLDALRVAEVSERSILTDMARRFGDNP